MLNIVIISTLFLHSSPKIIKFAFEKYFSKNVNVKQMMKLQQVESLLLQEMEDVKGGLVGTCECTKGAGQSSENGGTCSCSGGGAGQMLNDKKETIEISKCICGDAGGAGQ